MPRTRFFQGLLQLGRRVVFFAGNADTSFVDRNLRPPWILDGLSRAGSRETIGLRQAHVSVAEARSLLSSVNLSDYKKQQQQPTPPDYILLDDFLDLCKKMDMASSEDEGQQLAKSLEECGAILIFRNRIFLRPHQVAQALANVMPICLAPEDDPRRDELARLEMEKADIDRIARRKVRVFLWSGLAGFSLMTLAFFRLTFWDLSWDVMEPITYYFTYSSLLASYLFFLFTYRDPSYQGLTSSVFRSRQEKLMKKRNFNFQRYRELQMQCYSGWKSHSSI